MPPGGYEVSVPYHDAIIQAHRQLLKHNPAARQLRLRRDVVSLRAAIEACAVIHKAQREIDEQGRIVATLDDYRRAHDAFDSGMSALPRRLHQRRRTEESHHGIS
jgi:hypothetical protein